MNLSELIRVNPIIILHYSRIDIERLILIFLFDQSIQEGELGLLIHFSEEQMNTVNQITENNFNKQILSINDSIERMKDSINIFSSIDSFNRFIEFNSDHQDLIQTLNELNIKLLICDDEFRRLNDINSLHLDFSLQKNDKFIPIVFFDHDRRRLIESIKLIEEEKSLHFETIPEYEEFISIRDSVIDSKINLFFYIEYSKNGEISEEGIKYNQLIDRIETETKKIKSQKKELNPLIVKLTSKGLIN
jgi:hypothetical protein